jgi:hypothetical protein
VAGNQQPSKEQPVATQTRRTRKAKAETAKAEERIEEAVAEAKANSKRAKGTWPCTAEEIVAERDGAERSWAQVAVNLGLGSPGQARKAYTELTGRPHYESQAKVKRQRSTTGGVARKVDSPGWNDDTDQGAIEERLNGTWVEEAGNVPAHWTGSDIVVSRSSYLAGHTFDEEVAVKYVTEFSYGKNGDQPLQVTIIDRYSGAHRCFRVADITEVR